MHTFTITYRRRDGNPQDDGQDYATWECSSNRLAYTLQTLQHHGQFIVGVEVACQCPCQERNPT